MGGRRLRAGWSTQSHAWQGCLKDPHWCYCQNGHHGGASAVTLARTTVNCIQSDRSLLSRRTLVGAGPPPGVTGRPLLRGTVLPVPGLVVGFSTPLAGRRTIPYDKNSGPRNKAASSLPALAFSTTHLRLPVPLAGPRLPARSGLTKIPGPACSPSSPDRSCPFDLHYSPNSCFPILQPNASLTPLPPTRRLGRRPSFPDLV